MAEKSNELTEEIRENRPLTGNLIFSGFISNRVDTEFTADSAYGTGVGDCTHSWAVDLQLLRVWHVAGRVFGSHYRAGDVVGVALDVDAKNMYFGLNGVWTAPFGLGYVGASSTSSPAIRHQPLRCRAAVL